MGRGENSPRQELQQLLCSPVLQYCLRLHDLQHACAHIQAHMVSKHPLLQPVDQAVASLLLFFEVLGLDQVSTHKHSISFRSADSQLLSTPSQHQPMLYGLHVYMATCAVSGACMSDKLA